jgi:DNA-binding beta-propeller fold protein YncE
MISNKTNKNNTRKSSENNKKTKKNTKNTKNTKNRKNKTIGGGDNLNIALSQRIGTQNRSIATLLGSREKSMAPLGVAVSSDNQIYVIYAIDGKINHVRIFNGNTINTIYPGPKYSDKKIELKIDSTKTSPYAIAVSATDKRIYIVETYKNCVQVFNGTTDKYKNITTIGTTGSLGSSNKQFKNPYGIAVSSSDNRIYVADTGNHRIQVFDGNSNYNYIATIGTTGSAGTSNTQFNDPHCIAVSSKGNLIYVSDSGNHRIQIFEYVGNTSTNDYEYDYGYHYIATIGTTGSAGPSNTQLNNPHGIAVSSIDNRIYVADTGNHRVQVFKYDDNTSTYNFITTIGIPYGIIKDIISVAGESNTRFNEPIGVAVSPTNRIYVADKGNRRVQVFDAKLLLLPPPSQIPHTPPSQIPHTPPSPPSELSPQSPPLNENNSNSKYNSKSNSGNTNKQSGGKKYKIMQCSQVIVGIPRSECLTKHCTGTKKFKNNMKKLSKLNYQHDKFVAKTCNLKFDKTGVFAETEEDYKCNSEQRKGKLFETILKLEKETSYRKCEEKHCAKEDKMDIDCMDLGEEQCRIKYKDLIENIEKTKKKKILPLADCM